MWRRRLLLIIAATLALGAAPSSAAPPAPPCAPGFGIGLVDVPVTKDPRAQTYIVDHVAPGARFSRRFQICNGTSAAVAVRLYPGAAELDAGGFRIVEGRGANELSGWVRIDPATATLQPGQRFLARATFSVPRDAQSGERYGVLLAELPGKQQASGVRVASRIGVRVYLDVGPGGAPRSDFVVDSLQAARDTDGSALVRAQVHNTGKRALDMTGSLSLRDGPGGVSGGPYPATVGTTLAPGQTEPVVVRLGQSVADGPWTARLTLRSGLLERRVEAGITFPHDAGGQAPPVDVEVVTPPADQRLNPWPALGVVAVVLLGIGLLVRRRRTTAQ